MTIRDIPNCCAGRIIIDFGYTNTNGAENHTNNGKNPTKQEIIDFLNVHTQFKNKFYIIFINNEQYSKIGRTITKCGFKRVSKQYHPEHNTFVYTYIKSNNGII